MISYTHKSTHYHPRYLRDIVEARQHLYDEGGADGQSGREVSILTVSPSGLGGVRQREGSLLLTLYVPQAQKAGGCYPTTDR